jgi:hypothetical protein
MATIIENYTTKIAATKTASEIQELLAKHGVQTIMLEYSEGHPVGVSFVAKTEWGEKVFRLPVNVDAMHQLLRAEKRAGRLPGISEPVAQDRAHAERVAWRVVAEWLRAQMTLIASRMATLDQVMLPYLVQGDGRSLYAAYREQGLRELTAGGESQ